MVTRGYKWLQLVISGYKYLQLINVVRLVTSGFKCFLIGFKWLQLVTSCYKWLQLVTSGTIGYNWLQMAKGGYNWLQLATIGHTWLQVVTSGYKWINTQIVKCGIKKHALEFICDECANQLLKYSRASTRP